MVRRDFIMAAHPGRENDDLAVPAVLPLLLLLAVSRPNDGAPPRQPSQPEPHRLPRPPPPPPSRHPQPRPLHPPLPLPISPPRPRPRPAPRRRRRSGAAGAPPPPPPRPARPAERGRRRRRRRTAGGTGRRPRPPRRRLARAPARPGGVCPPQQHRQGRITAGRNDRCGQGVREEDGGGRGGGGRLDICVCLFAPGGGRHGTRSSASMSCCCTPKFTHVCVACLLLPSLIWVRHRRQRRAKLPP